jgi:hypothetical protein
VRLECCAMQSAVEQLWYTYGKPTLESLIAYWPWYTFGNPPATDSPWRWLECLVLDHGLVCVFFCFVFVHLNYCTVAGLVLT